jgi:hypothetical protein
MEKMRPVETISGMGRVGVKENDRRSEFKWDMFVRTLVIVTMYPQHKKNEYCMNF